MRRQARRLDSRWAVGGVAALALAGWAATAAVVVALDPETLGNRVAFFAALGVALFATLGLVAHRLSYALFADPRYRGNLGRALQAGGVTAALCLAAVILQASHALTPVAGAALLVLLPVGQVAVLLRE